MIMPSPRSVSSQTEKVLTDRNCSCRPKLSPQTETHVHKLSGAENFLGLHAPSGSLVAGPGFPFPSVCVFTDRNCPHKPKLFLQTETVLTNRNPCPQIERCEEFTGASCPFRVTGCWPWFPYPIFLSVRCRWNLRGEIDSQVAKGGIVEGFSTGCFWVLDFFLWEGGRFKMSFYLWSPAWLWISNDWDGLFHVYQVLFCFRV